MHFKIGEAEATERARRVKMLIMDVDGVMTDGRIIIDSDGRETKFFNVQDGVGCTLAKRSGLILAMLTARRSEVTSRRAEELGISLVKQVVGTKHAAYNELVADAGLEPSQVAYMGDDIHDIGPILRSGLGVAVANAVPEVQSLADCRTSREGGRGAVREAIDFILRAQGVWDKVAAEHYPDGEALPSGPEYGPGRASSD